MQNLSIGKKLSLLVGISLLILVISGGVAMNRGSKVKNKWDEYQAEVAMRSSLIAELKTEFGYGGAIHNFKNYVIRSSQKYADRSHAKLKRLIELIAKYKSIEGIGTSEIKSLEIIADTANKYSAAVDTASRLFAQGKETKEVDVVIKINDTPAIEALAHLTEVYGKLTEEHTRGVHSSVTQLKTVAAISIIVALVLLVLVGYYIGRSISLPVAALAEAASRMAEGDLTQKVDITSGDEIGTMARAFNNMSSSLNKIMTQVSDASSRIASSSEEISAASSQMAAGAENQNLQTAQAASAAEEMSATVTEVSRNSNAAFHASQEAAQVAKSGGEIVSNTIAGMGRIAETVKDSAKTIEKLGKSSDQIGEIIDVIDDIADQTNLLALNAAIEAARAGEQGRGFAVVADEVRKLAERTTKATKEIGTMIKSIQTETGGAVAAMSAGRQEVEGGVEFANEAGRSLTQIVAVVGSVTGMLEQIAAGAEEQSAAAEEISNNVEAVASVSKETAAAVQESISATRDLAKLAEELKVTVGKFKLS